MYSSMKRDRYSTSSARGGGDLGSSRIATSSYTPRYLMNSDLLMTDTRSNKTESR